MTAAAQATCVYALIAAARKPRIAREAKGLAGGGPVRLIEVVQDAGRPLLRRSLRCWLVVSDVPLSRYSESAIQAGLNHLDWVSRAAMTHEAVIEGFRHATAVLPMKLFTIFRSDERALEFVNRERPRLHRALVRVAGHDEWGVRVTTPAPTSHAAKAAAPASGAGYLKQKLAVREKAVRHTREARAAATMLYSTLAKQAKIAERRTATEFGVKNGPLVLDAVFLVPRTDAPRFTRTIQRYLRTLERTGCRVTRTGPWPPYSFVQD